jgi:hypothetical protein
MDDHTGDPRAADEAVIAKVRKLLAMAEGTDNTAEADAFSRKAADLIVRHRLSPEALAAVDPSELVMREIDIGRGAYVRARFHLLSGIAGAHGCFATFATRMHGTVAHISGHRRDVSTVEVLYSSLHQQMAARAAGQRRATAAATQRFRRSFMFGFADEVAVMLASAQEAAIAEHPDPGTVLPALLAQAERVRTFAGERLGRIVTARPVAPAVRDGFVAGRRAAADADIGRARLRSVPAIDRR